MRLADPQPGKSLGLALRCGIPVIRFLPRAILSLPKPCSLSQTKTHHLQSPSPGPQLRASQFPTPTSEVSEVGSGERSGSKTQRVFLIRSASVLRTSSAHLIHHSRHQASAGALHPWGPALRLLTCGAGGWGGMFLISATET